MAVQPTGSVSCFRPGMTFDSQIDLYDERRRAVDLGNICLLAFYEIKSMASADFDSLIDEQIQATLVWNYDRVTHFKLAA